MIHYTFTISYDKAQATLRLPGSAMLYDLAEALIEAVGFDFDHAFGFCSNLQNPYAKDMERTYTLLADQGEALRANDQGVVNTRVDQAFEKGEKMLFHFDYGDDWRFLIECIDIQNTKSRKRKAEILKISGTFPEQYPEPEDDDLDDGPTFGINLMTGERITLKKS